MNNYEFLSNFVSGEEPYSVACYGHLLKLGEGLYNYSTLICEIDGNKARLNVRKYSRTTTRIQSTLRRILENKGFEIIEYEGDPCTYWNFGYMGAENWTMNDLKQRGII